MEFYLIYACLYQSNGVAITVLGGSVYGLFTTVDNPWAINPTYLASTVVKLDVSGTNPTVAAQASVGKNAFTLTPYGGKLSIASIGGKQQSESYNTGESKLNVVTPGTTLSVATPFTASSTLPGDFRDITFSEQRGCLYSNRLLRFQLCQFELDFI